MRGIHWQEVQFTESINDSSRLKKLAKFILRNCKFRTTMDANIHKNSVSLTNIAATKVAVQKYDELLQQITTLKRENHELKEIIRSNEERAGLLIEHYKSEIEAQTHVVTGLKDELRSKDEMEMIIKSRTFHDVSTWIEEHELLSKEKELFDIINVLEDEIQSLMNDKINQAMKFEKKTIANQENIKQSFMQDVNDLRNRISESVCEEVRDAIEHTINDNHRLKSEFRLLLLELEKVQESRDRKDIELIRTRRELELLRQTNKLGSGISRCENT